MAFMPHHNAFGILIVCTGNICRSPAAERLLAHELDRDGGFVVHSAGTHALVGAPIAGPMSALLETNGLSSAGSSARQLTREMLAEANLVLTMTRAHRSAVAGLFPAVVRRSFTLREFAALLSLPDAEAAAPATNRVARLSAALEWASLHRSRVVGASAHDLDVIDPYRRSRATYQKSFGQLAPAVQTIARFTNR
jgi:protein-tyrosine phosphatase